MLLHPPSCIQILHRVNVCLDESSGEAVAPNVRPVPRYHDDNRGQCDQREEQAERSEAVELRRHHSSAQYSDLQAHPPGEPGRLVRVVPVRLAKSFACTFVDRSLFCK